MGTNYYVKINTCQECGRSEEEIHIGKSSYGWQFLFAYNGGEYYKNKNELEAWLEGRKIFDEYDREISKEDFWEMIETKQATRNPSDGHFMTIEEYTFMDGEFS
jgi:hypothetical protein